MNKLKVGLLGLGRVADHHNNYLAKNKKQVFKTLFEIWIKRFSLEPNKV